jgi:DNA-directed RNA polymerase subunit RPC12/RpoP
MKKKYDRGFILGGSERRDETEKEYKCFFCGNPCFFTDKWDFVKLSPVCQNCGIERIKKGLSKGNADYILHEKTIKSLAKHFNIEEWEANILARKLLYEHTGVEPKLVKKMPQIKNKK